jgi:acetyl-CoA acetyltransferase
MTHEFDNDVEYVITGQVLQAGAGQIPTRQAAHNAGIPLTVPAVSVNKVCLSGLAAIALADQLMRAGEYDVIVAGGQESMTAAPSTTVADQSDQGTTGRRWQKTFPGGLHRTGPDPTQ